MGTELTPAQEQSARFLEALYDAHPERATGGFRPPRVSELQGLVDKLQGRVTELERSNSGMRSAVIENGLLKKTIENQQAEIEKLIKEIDTSGNLLSGVPTIKQIVTEVAKFYGLKLTEICGTNRLASLVRARHIAIYLARELTGKSFPIIGRSIGGRDHTTAMHAHRVIAERLNDDERLGDEVTLLKIKLMEGQ